MSSTQTYRAFVDHLGAYSATKAYVKMDEVRFGTPAGTYRNILACTGVAPTAGGDNANWVLVAAPGATGETGAVGVDATAPVGSVIFHAKSTPPAGYLRCNGALLSRTTYSALYAANGTIFGAGDGSTTFALPDLRGEFVRGWDDGRGMDSGRVFGGVQDGTWLRTVAQEWSGSDLESGQYHIGTSYAGADAEISTGLSDSVPTGAKSPAGGGYNNATTDNALNAEANVDQTANVNHWIRIRPRNIALLPCIKY